MVLLASCVLLAIISTPFNPCPGKWRRQRRRISPNYLLMRSWATRCVHSLLPDPSCVSPRPVPSYHANMVWDQTIYCPRPYTGVCFLQQFMVLGSLYACTCTTVVMYIGLLSPSFPFHYTFGPFISLPSSLSLSHPLSLSPFFPLSLCPTLPTRCGELV